jgi:hypothetical protein
LDSGEVASDMDGGAVGTARARRGDGADSGGAVERAVGTPARGPDSALKARNRRSTAQPRGDGALTGGPGAESGG